MFISERIKEIRIEQKKTQEETAKLLSVSRSTYAVWESNNEIIPIKRLVQFCEIFNTSLDYILDLSNKSTLNKKFQLAKQGERLKNWRKDNNITQEKLANFLKTNKSVICGYEKNRYLIATPFLYDICKKYKVSADYLLGRIDNPNPL